MEFRNLLSRLKSEELKQRWQDKEYRKRIADSTRKTSLKIWSDPEHRRIMSWLSAYRWQDQAYREKMIEKLKLRWKSPEFRSKYSSDHFRKAAQALWSDPSIRDLHREKAKKQWQDPQFKIKFIHGVIESNRRRLRANPGMMQGLAAKAAVSLRKKWQDPAYKEKVAKSRILRYVGDLINTEQPVTPELYSDLKQRGTPCLNTALKHFMGFEDMLLQARQRLNHKVKRIEPLSNTEDVYDLTIDPWHNFALASGIFVHNSVDGDNAAAMRYTEARLAAITDEMLNDIDKDTVNFGPNFDSSLKEPLLLPAALPNLLVNGSSGIAVGMATNIPSHNLERSRRRHNLSIG